MAVAVFAMGMLFSPRNPNQSARAPSQQYAEARSSDSPAQYDESGWSWITKDAAGFFTFFLVIVGSGQALLFLWQLKLIGESLTPAKEAAEAASEAAVAAKVNTQAIIEFERARFYAVIKYHSFDKFIKAGSMYPNSTEMATDGNAAVQYFFKNYGKTPAIYRENSHGIVISAQPPEPVYALSEQIPTQHMIEPGSGTDDQVCSERLPINTVGDVMPIYRGESFFWFFGSIDYTDVFGEQRVDRFLFRYVKLGGKWRFQPYDYKHYNSSGSYKPPT